MRFRIDRIVLQSVACLIRAHLQRAQIVGPAAAVHLRLGTEIGVRAGNVTGSAPLRARYDAAEQRERTLDGRRPFAGRRRSVHIATQLIGIGDAAAVAVAVVSRMAERRFAQLTEVVLSVDDLTLVHQLDHLVEFDLQWPIDVAEFMQETLTGFVFAVRWRSCNRL